MESDSQQVMLLSVIGVISLLVPGAMSLPPVVVINGVAGTIVEMKVLKPSRAGIEPFVRCA